MTIAGCGGTEVCPLITDHGANIAAFEAETLDRAPQVTNLLPPRLLCIFSRSVCECLVGIASTPAGGMPVDFDDARYSTPGAVVKAAYYGHCSTETAMIELMRRMDLTADVDVVARIKMSVDVLKTRGEMVIPAAVGLYTFIYARITNLDIVSSTVSIGSVSGVASRPVRSELTSTLQRPSSESQFYEYLLYFAQAVAALGLAHFSIVCNFISDVVHKARRELHLGWEICHELFLLYMNEIQVDVTKTLNFANVFGRGKHDTLIAQAKVNALLFFRTRAGTAQPGPASSTKIEWNGKSTSSAAKCCVSWNLGKSHPASCLDASGTCLHKHVCMQYVTDKGPGGQCLGKHPRTECTYPADKRCSSPTKQ